MMTLKDLGKDEWSVLNALGTAESMEDGEIAGAARLSLTEVHDVLGKLLAMRLVVARTNGGGERFELDAERVRQLVEEASKQADDVLATGSV
jgi:hypothetical protein